MAPTTKLAAIINTKVNTKEMFEDSVGLFRGLIADCTPYGKDAGSNQTDRVEMFPCEQSVDYKQICCCFSYWPDECVSRWRHLLLRGLTRFCQVPVSHVVSVVDLS